MNWFKKQMPNLKSAGISAALLCPIALGSIVYWAHNTHEKLNSITESHWVRQSSIQNSIERDIEDLENQILRSTGRVPVGEFSFYQTTSGLKATHTSLLNQSINITIENGQAFQTALNSQNNGHFIVVSKKLEPIAYSENSRSFAMLAASRKDFIEKAGTRPLLLKNFDAPIFSSSSSWKKIFSQPEYSFVSTPIKSSNLSLVSFVSLSQFWTGALTSLGFTFASLFGSLILLFGFIKHGQTKALKSSLWVEKVFDGLKAGKLDTEALEAKSGGETVVAKSIKNSLLESSALQKLLSAHWVDASRRLATWTHFSTTLRAWSEGVSVDQSIPPKHWALGTVQVSNPAVAEMFCRSFNRCGNRDSIYIFSVDKDTLQILSASHSLKELITHVSSTIKDFYSGTELHSFDIGFSVYFFGSNMEKDPFKLLEASRDRVALLGNTTRKSVDSRNFEIRSAVSDSVLFFDGFTPKEVARPQPNRISFETPKSDERYHKKRVPVPKKRVEEKTSKLKLPPPPTLQSRIRAKSLNSGKNAGKAFIKVSDALGGSKWVEVQETNETSKNA